LFAYGFGNACSRFASSYCENLESSVTFCQAKIISTNFTRESLKVTILAIVLLAGLVACTLGEKNESTQQQNSSDTLGRGGIPSAEPFPAGHHTGGLPNPGSKNTSGSGNQPSQPAAGGAQPESSKPPEGGVDNLPPSKPPLPLGKAYLELKVVQQNFDAWWKNCLVIEAGVESAFVSCNKDASAVGKTVNLVVDAPPSCNALVVKIQTYKNLPNTCQEGSPCKGPYPIFSSWTRSSAVPSNQKFFKVFHKDSSVANDPLLRPLMNESFESLKSNMEQFSNAGKNRMLRVFFEDQPAENLDSATLNTALAEQNGIDFNDTTFDISGVGVRFYVSGVGPQGCFGQ
jgi:hypothetical protein